MKRECLSEDSQGAASLAIGLVLPRTHTPCVRFPTENPGKTPLGKTVRRTVDVRRTSEPPAERAPHKGISTSCSKVLRTLREISFLPPYGVAANSLGNQETPGDQMSAGHRCSCLWNPGIGTMPKLFFTKGLDPKTNLWRHQGSFL